MTIATEAIGLEHICKRLNISHTTVFDWLERFPDFAKSYARAREMQADLLFDQIMTIADTQEIGTKTETTDKGVKEITGDMIEHRRLRIDSRKFLAGKLRPTKYGDKIDIISGNERISAIEVTIVPSPRELQQDTTKTISI